MADDLVFGFSQYGSAIASLELRDVTYSEGGSSSDSLGEDGYIKQINRYAPKRTLSANGVVKVGSDLSALVFGATLTVDSVEYKIDTISIKEGAGAEKTCSITASAPMPAPDAGD